MDGLALTSFQLTGLTPESTYSVRVVASDGDLAKGRNAINLFTTTPLSSNTAPTAPTGVAATDIANESALITWVASTDDDGDALDYQVDFRVTGATEWTNAGSTSLTSMALTSLTPNTRYDVLVTANDGTATTGTEVLELFATTYGTPAPPSIP